MNNIILCGQTFECNNLKGVNKNSLSQIDQNQYKALNSGILKEHQQHMKFVPVNMHYYPNVGDRVIGYVEKRHGDSYQIEIKGYRKALLGYLEFEGATKKNKPDLKPGTIIYARIQECSSYTETILTCISKTVKKDWNSGEAFYGELKDGYDIEIPCFFAYFLLNDESFFEILKRKISLEVCIGINGILWLKTSQSSNYLILQNFFQKAPYYSKDKATELLLGMMNDIVVQLFNLHINKILIKKFKKIQKIQVVVYNYQCMFIYLFFYIYQMKLIIKFMYQVFWFFQMLFNHS